MKKLTHSLVIPSEKAKSRHFFPSHLFTFHSLVQLLLPTVKLNGVSQPIFNRIQDGTWLKSSCAYNLRFRKLSNFGSLQFPTIFYNMSQPLHCVQKHELPL